MYKLFLALTCSFSLTAAALPPDSERFDEERDMLRAVFAHLQTKVDGRACDLKSASSPLQVADLILSYTLWSTQSPREGVERRPSFGCSDSSDGAGYRDCYLTAGEKIELPGEPEGWSRSLLFRYSKQKKNVLAKSFRCLDVP